MSVKLSTGCVQLLAEDKTLKEIFHDGVIRIYSGYQPSTADDAVNGTLLVEITKDGNTFAAGTKSARQSDKVTIGSSADNDVFTVVINEGLSNEESYSYTASSDTTSSIASALAALIDESRTVEAVASGADIIIRARFGGVSYTLGTTGSTGTISTANLVANSRANGIQWGSATGGVLYKETGDWKGTVGTAGTAAYFRICGNDPDSGGSDTTLPRIDGTVGTVSGDLILRTVDLAVNDVIIIGQAAITIPKQ